MIDYLNSKEFLVGSLCGSIFGGLLAAYLKDWLSLARAKLSAHEKLQLDAIKTSLSNDQNRFYYTSLKGIRERIKTLYYVLIAVVLLTAALNQTGGPEVAALFYLGLATMTLGIVSGVRGYRRERVLRDIEREKGL